MERKDFLNNIGQLSLLVCAGALIEACSKSSPDSGNNPGGGGGGGGNNPLLTANLATELTAVGSSKISGNVIVVRTAAGNEASSFVALSLICTHMSCTVGYDASASDFKCPCHGSQYDINGQVIQGPAPRALTKYTVSIDNGTLTVK